MKKIVQQMWNSTIILRVFTIACAFISNIFINRALGISLKGQYTSIYAYANFIQLVCNLGICYAYANIRNKYAQQAKFIMCTIVWGQAALLFLATLISTIISSNAVWTMLIATLLICDNQLVFLAVIDDILSRNKILVWTSVLYVVLTGIAFLLFKNNLNIIFICLIFKLIVEIFWVSCRFKYFTIKPKLLSRGILKTVLKIGIPTAVLAVLISCNYNIDIFLLNLMKCDDTQIGIFGVAYTLTNMLWVLPDAFKELVYNKSANKASEKIIVSLIIINIIICIVICIGFAIFGRLFLEIVYGREYVQAFPTTMILFIGVIPMVAFKLIHPIYVNEGKSVMVVKLLVASIVCNLVSSLFLIPRFEALGAAFASVISYMVCSILFVRRFAKDYEITREDVLKSVKGIKVYISRFK